MAPYIESRSSLASFRAITVLSALAVLMLACMTAAPGCGGGSNQPLQAVTGDQPASTPFSSGGANFPPPAELKDLAYTLPDLTQNGGDFLTDPAYPYANVTAMGNNARFKPDQQPGPLDLDDLSYAVYGFDLEDYDLEHSIAMTFFQTGDPEDSWLGLANWGANSWDWFGLPEGGELVQNLDAYLQPVSGRLLMVPLFTGKDTWDLQKIWIGEEQVIPDKWKVDGNIFEMDGTTPVQGVAVQLAGTSTYIGATDSAGHWELINVPEGDYTVTPVKYLWEFTPPTAGVSVAGADQTVANFLGEQLFTYTVDGYIYEDGGTTPLDGVVVDITGDNTYSAETNAAGHWYVLEVLEGNYTATPHSWGWDFDPLTRDFAVAGGNLTLDPFEGLPAPTYEVTGILQEQGTGAPMDNFQVEITGDTNRMLLTGVDGRFSTDLSAGSYTARPVPKEGWTFIPVVRNFAVSGAPVDLDAFTGSQTSGLVKGFVFEEDGETPIENVRVQIDGDYTLFDNTAANGYWYIDDVPVGAYTATPSMPGWAFMPETRDIYVTAGETTVPVFTGRELALVTLDGYVYLDDEVTPLADVLVLVDGDYTYYPYTDAEGHWQMPNVLEGDYTIEPTYTGYGFTPESRDVSVGTGNMTIDPFLATAWPSFTVEGDVFEDDEITPLEDVLVQLVGAEIFSAQTDEYGHWIATGVYEDTYDVIPIKLGYDFTPPDRIVVVNGADVEVDDFLGTEQPQYELSGRVVQDDETTPISGVEITIMIDPPIILTSNAMGYYTTNLYNGHYNLTAYLEGWSFSPPEQTIDIENADAVAEDFIGTPES